MSHDIFQLPNLHGSKCLITERILDPKKRRTRNLTASSGGDTSGGFSSVENQYTHHPSGQTNMTLAWFNKIMLAPVTQKHLAYPESCLIVDDNGESIGKTYTSVDITSWAGTPCLLVHSGSYAKLGPDVDVGTSLSGFITPDLKVIHELSHEWSSFHGMKFDRKTFLSADDLGTSLHCRSTLLRDEVTKYDRVTIIPFVDLKTFVSEAANILLHRLIMLEKKTGSITLKAMNSQGISVPVDYRTLGRGVETVKGDKIEVYGIRRSLWSDSIKNQGVAWDSVYNFYGRLVLRCQPEDNDYAMIPLWFRPIEEYDAFGHFLGMRPPIVWACDQELYSEYLMKKTELSAQYKTYVMDHPPLRALLSDFLQQVLFNKPSDILHFANEYFTPMLKTREDSPESSECETSSTCTDEDEEEEENVNPETEAIFQKLLELHRQLSPVVGPHELPMFVEVEEDDEETDLETSDGTVTMTSDEDDVDPEHGIQNVSEAEEGDDLDVVDV